VLCLPLRDERLTIGVGHEAGKAHDGDQVLPGHEADPRRGRVRLVAVTGASAGSINAVISAALWCSDPVLTHTSVDDNPLRNTFGPAVQAAINRTSGLSRDAWALAQSRGGERALVVSTRFAPIVGSQLANLGAFLDVPLREFDYYAGVYDASHAFAVFLCGVSIVPGMTSSVRRSDKPDELDLAAPETQRCLGEALHVVAASLDLQRSSRATLVLRALARVELAASLDSSAAAEELLGKPAGDGWRKARLHARRTPAWEQSQERCCPRAPLAQSTRAKRSACAT